MDTLFPFGFPWQTSLYLLLYLVTLAMHMVFMNYVIAGAFMLSLDSFRPFRKGEGERRGIVGELLKDWMPFALGGAITAGVAPILFIQILYRDRFYTANLLLFHRWMAILPVLIVGFYLLYVLKSQWLARRKNAVRTLVVLAALFCFLFVGYSWTENHLLANQGQSTWTQFYESRTIFYYDQTLISRLLVWFFAAFPTMWMVLGWQLRRLQISVWQRSVHDAGQPPSDFEPETASTIDWDSITQSLETADLLIAVRRVARNAMLTLLVTLVAAISYMASLSPDVQTVLFSPLTSPYLVVAVLGFALQFIGWRRAFATSWLGDGHLVWVTGGLVLTMFSMLVQREAIRLAQVDISDLYARHAESAQVGGLGVFLLFLLINAAIIGWCIRQIAREQKQY